MTPPTNFPRFSCGITPVGSPGALATGDGVDCFLRLGVGIATPI
jgi:hypothetical protein